DGAVRLSVELTSHSYAAVRDMVRGDLKGEARLARGQLVDEIYLPAEVFRSAKRLFVKVVSSRGFFDRAGWFGVHLAQPLSDIVSGQRVPGAEPRVCCVIPCYNLAAVCGPIVRAAAGFAGRVIAVNDGSVDETESVLREVAATCANVEVVTLPKNCGKGIALLEAFRHARTGVPFDVLVTLDGDGQHRPEDIPRLAR